MRCRLGFRLEDQEVNPCEQSLHALTDGFISELEDTFVVGLHPSPFVDVDERRVPVIFYEETSDVVCNRRASVVLRYTEGAKAAEQALRVGRAFTRREFYNNGALHFSVVERRLKRRGISRSPIYDRDGLVGGDVEALRLSSLHVRVATVPVDEVEEFFEALRGAPWTLDCWPIDDSVLYVDVFIGKSVGFAKLYHVPIDCMLCVEVIGVLGRGT